MASSWDQLLARLYEQNQFAIKYDLDAMAQALDAEGLNEVAPERVLIAGTNGKGTVSSTLHSCLAAAGVRSGLFTSPHLVDFRERIRVDGRVIPEEDAARLGWELWRRYSGRDEPARGPRPLSYFELATLLALRWFREQAVEVAILEVGLGGRLDATNACDPTCSVVTSVGLDHQAWLGDTVERIAWEKAHVARAGRPLFVCPHAGGIEAVLATPFAQEARLVRVASRSLRASAINRALAEATAFHVLARRGIHIRAALSAVRLGLRRSRWPGRQERRHLLGRELWIDGAHNADAMKEASRWLDENLRTSGLDRIDLLVGLSPGRRASELLGPIVDRLGEVGCVAVDAQRSQHPQEVVEDLARSGIEAKAWPDVRDAVRSIGSKSRPLLVLGSLYLVGRVFAVAGLTADELTLWDETTEGRYSN